MGQSQSARRRAGRGTRADGDGTLAGSDACTGKLQWQVRPAARLCRHASDPADHVDHISDMMCQKLFRVRFKSRPGFGPGSRPSVTVPGPAGAVAPTEAAESESPGRRLRRGHPMLSFSAPKNDVFDAQIELIKASINRKSICRF